jgi:hypothetical protein
VQCTLLHVHDLDRLLGDELHDQQTHIKHATPHVADVGSCV